MTIGYVGLGKMGKNMVLRLLSRGVRVVAWNRSDGPLVEVETAGAVRAADIPDLVAKLQAPRIIWLMLPSGDVTETILGTLAPLLSPGDLVTDGGNSLWKDSVRRAKTLNANGIRFADVGVSGGPDGARNGACMMAGGTDEDYASLLPVLTAAAAENAYVHTGPVGSGHFAKMVHNGIEYGMMEAIAEGAAVLESSPYGFDLSRLFRLYDNRSVIASRLVGWAAEAFAENPGLEGISSVIAHTGEGEWTVDAARELRVDVPVIAASLDVRKQSSEQPDSFRNRTVSALRGKFGRHDIRQNGR